MVQEFFSTCGHFLPFWSLRNVPHFWAMITYLPEDPFKARNNYFSFSFTNKGPGLVFVQNIPQFSCKQSWTNKMVRTLHSGQNCWQTLRQMTAGATRGYLPDLSSDLHHLLHPILLMVVITILIHIRLDFQCPCFSAEHKPEKLPNLFPYTGAYTGLHR